MIRRYILLTVTEYKTYLNEYNQKYEIKKDGEHMRSMEPEEVE